MTVSSGRRIFTYLLTWTSNNFATAPCVTVIDLAILPPVRVLQWYLSGASSASSQSSTTQAFPLGNCQLGVRLHWSRETVGRETIPSCVGVCTHINVLTLCEDMGLERVILMWLKCAVILGLFTQWVLWEISTLNSSTGTVLRVLCLMNTLCSTSTRTLSTLTVLRVVWSSSTLKY